MDCEFSRGSETQQETQTDFKCGSWQVCPEIQIQTQQYRSEHVNDSRFTKTVDNSQCFSVQSKGSGNTKENTPSETCGNKLQSSQQPKQQSSLTVDLQANDSKEQILSEQSVEVCSDQNELSLYESSDPDSDVRDALDQNVHDKKNKSCRRILLYTQEGVGIWPKKDYQIMGILNIYEQYGEVYIVWFPDEHHHFSVQQSFSSLQLGFDTEQLLKDHRVSSSTDNTDFIRQKSVSYHDMEQLNRIAASDYTQLPVHASVILPSNNVVTQADRQQYAIDPTPLHQLQSIRKGGWQFQTLVVVLKSGVTLPTFVFNQGGRKALIKVLKEHLYLEKSAQDPHLYITSTTGPLDQFAFNPTSPNRSGDYRHDSADQQFVLPRQLGEVVKVIKGYGTGIWQAMRNSPDTHPKRDEAGGAMDARMPPRPSSGSMLSYKKEEWKGAGVGNGGVDGVGGLTVDSRRCTSPEAEGVKQRSGGGGHVSALSVQLADVVRGKGKGPVSPAASSQKAEGVNGNGAHVVGSTSGNGVAADVCDRLNGGADIAQCTTEGGVGNTNPDNTHSSSTVNARGQYNMMGAYQANALYQGGPNTASPGFYGMTPYSAVNYGHSSSTAQETQAGSFELVDPAFLHYREGIQQLPPRHSWQTRLGSGVPVSLEEYNSMLDERGVLSDLKYLLQRVQEGGVCKDAKKYVWKWLLGMYQEGSTAEEREADWVEKKRHYKALRHQWISIDETQMSMSSKWRERLHQIDKDVRRTDRTHRTFTNAKGSGFKVLRNVLLTYAQYNFDLGYSQGMSDVASPLVYIMKEETDAFWAFVAYMHQYGAVFDSDKRIVAKQLDAITQLVGIIDAPLYQYLASVDCLKCNCFFPHLLLLFKRVVPFDQVIQLWEAFFSCSITRNLHVLACVAILLRYKRRIIAEQMDHDALTRFFLQLAKQQDLNVKDLVRDAYDKGQMVIDRRYGYLLNQLG